MIKFILLKNLNHFRESFVLFQRALQEVRRALLSGENGVERRNEAHVQAAEAQRRMGRRSRSSALSDEHQSLCGPSVQQVELHRLVGDVDV